MKKFHSKVVNLEATIETEGVDFNMQIPTESMNGKRDTKVVICSEKAKSIGTRGKAMYCNCGRHTDLLRHNGEHDGV